MRWSETIRLMPCRKEVYADLQSVGRSEFYAALSAGETVDLLFKVRHADYHDEKDLIFEGTFYKVIRSYRKTDDFTILSCQRRDRLAALSAPHEWELTDTVALWDLVTTETDIGEKQTPSHIDTFAAKVETTSGRAYEEERRAKAEISHKVTIAARDDIGKGMCFIWKDRRLNIDYIVDLDGAGVIMECFCVEDQKYGRSSNL